MIITVDKEIYSKEVLLKTAYSLTDKVYFHLSQNTKEWLVSWVPKAGQSLESGEFENELIAQSLREQLLRDTADIRKIILARAYASTVLDIDCCNGENFEDESSSQTNTELDYSLTEEEKDAVLRGWFDQK